MRKLSDTKRIMLICVAAFYIVAMAVVVYLFFIRGVPSRAEAKEKENEEVEAYDDISPAMVVIDPDSGLEEIVIYPEPEQITESQNKALYSEAETEELGDRLKRMDGLLPEHGTGYILVGDSRFVHMNQVCKISDVENLFVVAKVGEGYSWFANTAMPQIKRIISSGLFSKWKIIICLGINDLESLPQYEKKYNELKDKYDISLVSVNPITSYGRLSNSKIESFNSAIKKLDFPYIDTYRLLQATGYACTDGLHYDADTSKKIFKGILMGLEDENPSALTSDKSSVLDKASLGKKKSIQSEIIAANKTLPKQISENLLTQGTADGEASPDTQEEENKTTESAPAAEEPAPHEYSQEEIDALYGIKRDEEGNVVDDDHHHHDDDDDDEDD